MWRPNKTDIDFIQETAKTLFADGKNGIEDIDDVFTSRRVEKVKDAFIRNQTIDDDELKAIVRSCDKDALISFIIKEWHKESDAPDTLLVRSNIIDTDILHKMSDVIRTVMRANDIHCESSPLELTIMVYTEGAYLKVDGKIPSDGRNAIKEAITDYISEIVEDKGVNDRWVKEVKSAPEEIVKRFSDDSNDGTDENDDAQDKLDSYMKRIRKSIDSVLTNRGDSIDRYNAILDVIACAVMANIVKNPDSSKKNIIAMLSGEISKKNLGKFIMTTVLGIITSGKMAKIPTDNFVSDMKTLLKINDLI